MLSVILLLISLIALDQISKFWIIQNLQIGESIKIIDGLFSIGHIRNPGAAWGFLAETSWGIWLLTMFSFLVSCFLLFLLSKLQKGYLRFAFILLTAGSIGNLIDRFFRREVIDFLSFQFGKYSFPSFNFADSMIVIACFLLFIILISDDGWNEFEMVLASFFKGSEE